MMRLDYFLANLKYTSRKDVKKFLKSNEVVIEGIRIFDPSFKFNPTKTSVLLNNEIIFYQAEVNLMLNKPKNYLSAHSDLLHKVVFELLKEPFNRFEYTIAGRLDLDSEGLLILTTNGTFAHEIMSPKKQIKKVYQVVLDKPFKDELKLLNGILIKDGNNNDYLAKALKIKKNNNEVDITIDEGKFHQVKRMFKALDYEVLNLKRTKIGNLALNDLKLGEYKQFRKEDLDD